MVGEILSHQAVQELHARIQRAEEARRAKKASARGNSKPRSKRKAPDQIRRPRLAAAKAADSQ